VTSAGTQDKAALRAELVERLSADLDAMERAHQTTREGATHEEAKPENDKDTRALEQTYLARGQAVRVEQLRGELADIKALAVRDLAAGAAATLGTLVTVEEDGVESLLFLVPAGGGISLAGGSVQAITPRSPLGRALLGRRAGDDVEIVVAGKERALRIERVG
jgi:transcription elongation GreA/GreB family factor